MMEFITAFDRRTVGFAETEAWAMAMGDVPWDESTRQAIAEFYSAPGRDGDRFIQPHHVRAGRSKIRSDRLDRVPEPVPNDVDGVDYLDELRAVRRAIADGRILTEADAERYREWGGSMHLAYRRGNPVVGPAIDAPPLRPRPVDRLLSNVFPDIPRGDR
jgi:hypothetical protein